MDGNDFDDVIRTTATGGTRRAALRTLAGGLLAALAPEAVSGKRKRGNKGNNNKGKHKGNKNKDPQVPCGESCCAIGTECCGGGCCAAGKCRVINGQSCCLKVIDNIPYCQAM